METTNTRGAGLSFDERAYPYKAVLFRLRQNGLTQAWLIGQLSRFGIRVNKSDMSSYLAGTRRGEKVDRTIRTAGHILDAYESFDRTLKERIERIEKNGI